MAIKPRPHSHQTKPLEGLSTWFEIRPVDHSWYIQLVLAAKMSSASSLNSVEKAGTVSPADASILLFEEFIQLLLVFVCTGFFGCFIGRRFL